MWLAISVAHCCAASGTSTRSFGFGMDAVAVEEFEFGGSRRKPDFGQAVGFNCKMKLALYAHDFTWDSVEEFVGEDDGGRFGIAGTIWSTGMMDRGVRPFLRNRRGQECPRHTG